MENGMASAGLTWFSSTKLLLLPILLTVESDGLFRKRARVCHENLRENTEYGIVVEYR